MILLVVVLMIGQQSEEPPAETVLEPVSVNQTMEITPFPDSSTMSTAGKEETHRQYAEYVEQSTAVGAFTTFSDSLGIVPLNRWVSAVDARIEPDLLNLLDQKEWAMYKCASADVDYPYLVLTTRIALQSNYPGDLFADKVAYLSQWESTLTRNMSSVLYPVFQNGVSLPGQISTFESNASYPYIELREADLSLPNGKSGYIGYITIGDNVLVGNNQECLLEAQELMYDTGA